MQKINKRKIIVFLLPFFLFLSLSLFLFRPYFLNNKIPFAANLLVSYYQPWESYPFLGYPQGPANKPIGFDSLRIYYPFRKLTIESYKNFQLPLWNPYDFAGNTQLATYQSAAFFPLSFLYFIFPFIDAWSITIILGPFFASLFMYFFLKSLKISTKASILGALSFGFSGTILVLAEESFMSMYSILFLPLIMLGIQNMFEKKSFRWFALIIIGILFSILSGWFQSSLYAIGLSFVWLIFLTLQTKQYKTFFYGIFAFFLAFLLSSSHLIPNLESYFYSARGATNAKFLFSWYLVHPWHLITFLAPDFFGSPGTYNYFGKGFYYEKMLYIGVVGFLLGFIAFLSRKKTPQHWFFAISWIITLSLGLSLPTSWFFLYDLHLPFISTILPSRIFLLSAFCLSVLAGYGWDVLQNNKIKLPIIFSVLFVISMLYVAWQFVLRQKQIYPLGYYATVSLRNLFLPTLLSFCAIFAILFGRFIKQKYAKQLSYFLLFAVLITGIIYFGSKYLYFSEKRFIYPKNPVIVQLLQRLGVNRFWSFGPGYIERNFGAYYHLQTPEGYDSLYIKQYGEFIQATKNKGQYTSSVIRADAQFVSDQHLSEIGRNPYLLKALDLLGVTYIAAKTNADDNTYVLHDSSSRFKIAWTDNIYTLFKNTKAYPRAFLVGAYKVAINPENAFALMFSQNTDLRNLVVLDKNPGMHSSTTSFGNDAAKITLYSPEKVVVKTSANKDAILFLSDNYYPGWNVYVDGKKSKLFRADYTFRGVVVKKGTHTVDFVYQPVSMQIGFIFFGVGLLLFLVTGIMMKKR